MRRPQQVLTHLRGLTSTDRAIDQEAPHDCTYCTGSGAKVRQMSLPWVRLDTGIATHPKILQLLSDSSSKKHQAAFSYVCSIAWAGDHGTDGHIPRTALPFIHATTTTAKMLQAYRLWDEAPGGWTIHNFAERQELAAVQAAKKAAMQVGAAKGNCIRWHGPNCGCWRESA